MEENNKVPKMGTIAWHQYHIDRLSALRSKAAKSVTKKEGNSEDVMVEERKQPNTRYRSRVEYDFLKYIRVAFRWAGENHPNLTRSQIELLLYLHGLGAFSKNQFDDFHKLIGIYSIKTLDKFQDEGYIKVWRTSDKKSHRLYALTQKSRSLCSKLHRICCGVEDISLNPLNNKMIRPDAPRINTYYLDMIKKMNADKARDDSDQ